MNDLGQGKQSKTPSDEKNNQFAPDSFGINIDHNQKRLRRTRAFYSRKSNTGKGLPLATIGSNVVSNQRSSPDDFTHVKPHSNLGADQDVRSG